MKMNALIVLAGSLVLTCCTTEEAHLEVPGPYLGEKPPGMTPEIFAQGTISTDQNEGSSVFNTDGTEFIHRKEFSDFDQIYLTELADGEWTQPRFASFKSSFRDKDFTMAPDGKRLYLTSHRPPGDRDRGDIWVVEKGPSGWGSPVRMEEPVNTEHHEGHASVDQEGTIYFFRRGRGGFGKSDLFFSRLENGEYEEPENLGEKINSTEHDWDPFIAPDGRYLIFASTRPGGFGWDDLYICFRSNEGTWSEPINMGEKINSPLSDNRPHVTLDGNYFFLVSRRTGNGDIYWVDAQVIEELDPYGMLKGW